MIMTHTPLKGEEQHDATGTRPLSTAAGAYHVIPVDRPDRVAEALDGQSPDYIIIGAVLPAESGRALCRLLPVKGASTPYPVMLLKAANGEAPAGEDAAPTFAPTATTPPQDEEEVIEVQEIELTPTRYEVRVNGTRIDFSTTEFRLLHLLLDKPGRVFSRDAIIEHLRGRDYACTRRSVDVLIVSLRRKLGATGKHIRTVRGVGYCYRE